MSDTKLTPTRTKGFRPPCFSAVPFRVAFLLVMVMALPACRKAAPPVLEQVAFENRWSSAYRVSEVYPHHLVNAEGRYLQVLNKTAWAYFACRYPEKVLQSALEHGANVIRVCLEGAPYEEELQYDLWPWGGSRDHPDFTAFNEPYWNEVERRIELAGRMGIGIDLVLYFDLTPQAEEAGLHKMYWDRVLNRLSRYSNLLVWEIMNEEISNEAFQDSCGQYLKKHDPFRHPVISSDGTTDDALWPHKSWMDLAVVHTCTGNQPQYDLENWYLSIARNIRQYGKPAFNNESGREVRHRNDDPVHRRKQAWLFTASGSFWTWHSRDGCESIDDTTYRAPGWQYLRPMQQYFESIPFWTLSPSHTVCVLADTSLVYTAMTDPERRFTLAYCCVRESGKKVHRQSAAVRLRNGLYRVRFLRPEDLQPIGELILTSGGLSSPYTIDLPEFRDDLVIEIRTEESREKSLIEGTL